MSQNTDNTIDERPRTAVYSLLHSRRDHRAVILLHAFCAINGLRCLFYLDDKLPKEGQPSAWQRLLDDVSQGKFIGVITWLQSPEMEQFCQEHSTKFVEVDIFDWFRAMRMAKVDILR